MVFFIILISNSWFELKKKMKLYFYLLILCCIGCKTPTFIYDANQAILYPICNNGKWGYVNSDGEILVKPQFQKTFITDNGIGIVKSKNKYGYIKTNGAWLIKPTFDTAQYFNITNVSYGKGPMTRKILLAHVRDNAKDKFIDVRGKSIKTKNLVPSSICGNGALIPDSKYIIRNSDQSFDLTFKYIVTDALGRKELIMDTTNLNLDTIFITGDNAYLLKANGKYATILTGILEGVDYNKNVRIMVEDGVDYQPNIEFVFDDLKFSPKNINVPLWIAKKDNKWGTIDIYGNTIVPFDYLDLELTQGRDVVFVEYEKDKFGCLTYELIKDETSTYTYEIKEHFKRRMVGKSRR